MDLDKQAANLSRIMPEVMLVCDEVEAGRIWANILRQRHLKVTLVGNANDILATWEETIPDLIVLDIYSPELDGIAICQNLRSQTVTPILMFSGRYDEGYMLAAYRAGVDECEPKPVSPGIFIAKVSAWLRRSWTMPAEALDGVKAGNLRLDPIRRLVETDAGETIKLTNLEFRLLHVLMTHPGWTLESEVLIERVWGYQGMGDTNLLKNVVYRLRRKLGVDQENPSLILTDPGVGYKFQPDPIS